MAVPEFAIPLHLKDLENEAISAQFLVTDNLTSSEIESSLTAAVSDANEEGAEFIVQHFATFYHIIKHFKKVPKHLQEKAFKTLLKSFKKLTVILGDMLEDGIDSDTQFKICNITKMLGFALIEVAKRYQEHFVDQSNTVTKPKGKKNAKSEDMEDWIGKKTELTSVIYDFLQLPVKLLWDPPVVDEEFINIFANFCYVCLEDPSITGAAMQTFRSNLFQILSTLIRRHMHGLSFTANVVRLLRMHEHLVNPLAEGVVHVFESGCNHVVREIVREIGEVDSVNLSAGSSARCLSQFLVTVAEDSPSAIAPAVELLLAFLGKDPPALRCCALSVLGEVVKAILTKEDLEDDLKASRDSYLETIEDHIHDTNAFVRARALQVCQKLCLSRAIPLARLHNLMEVVIGRLGDKCSNVKKQAVQLIKVILEYNPYSVSMLDVNDINKQLNDEKSKLASLNTRTINKTNADWDLIEPHLRKELMEGAERSIAIEGLTFDEARHEIAKEINDKDFHRAVGVLNQFKLEFNEQLSKNMVVTEAEGEDVEASLLVLRAIWEKSQVVEELDDDVLHRKNQLERRITYLEGALEFALLIERALPLTLTLLDSPTQTDVLEAISFFTAAYKFGFVKSLEGVRRMLYLVFSKDENIKKAVCAAYRDLYFSNMETGRKQSLESVRKMCEVVIQLNASQMDAMQEVVKDWIQNKIIDKSCIQILFEKFSKKLAGTTDAESWAALVLISMIGAEQPKVISDNITVLVNEGLGPRGIENLLVAQYTCHALQKLRITDNNRLSSDDMILIRLRRTLKESIWGKDHRFVPFADEAIALVFTLAERPDQFVEKLLIDLFKAIKHGQKPVFKKTKGRMLNKEQNMSDDLFDDEEPEKSQRESEVESTEDVDLSHEAVILRLTRFINILGSVAVHYSGFLDGRVLNEFKRRNQVEFERRVARQEDKRGAADVSMKVENDELELMRQAEDERQTSQLRKIADGHIVSGEGLLAQFLPFIRTICEHPNHYPNESLQNAALNTLGMFMQVSQPICEANLQLLVTITKKGQSTEKRRNGLILLWALQFKYPNVLEPWTFYMVQLLKDEDTLVKRTAVNVITNLILSEMIKARTYASDLAALLVDPDVKIAQTTRHFFREFAQKGNYLFNVLPNIVNSLSGPCASAEPDVREDSTLSVADAAAARDNDNKSLGEESFRVVMKFIINMITKDKQHDLLVEKLCQYFECATTDRQCRDLAFCLSLFHYPEKSLRKLLDNFRCFAKKLYIAEVYESLMLIINQAARNPQKDKNLLDELQSLVKEYREKTCVDRNVAVELPNKRCPPSTRKRLPRRRQVSDSGEEEVVVPRSTRKVAPRSTRIPSDSESERSESSSDDDVFIKKKPARRRNVVSSDSDSSEFVPKVSKSSKRTPAKKNRGKQQIEFASDSDQEQTERTKPKR